MKDELLWRITGWAGVFMYLTVMTVIPLFFVYEGAPPASNVLTRVLASMFTCAAFVVFLVAFREVLKRAAPEHEFIGSLSFHTGFAYIVLIMVADSVQVGTVLSHGAPVDPTRWRNVASHMGPALAVAHGAVPVQLRHRHPGGAGSSSLARVAGLRHCRVRRRVDPNPVRWNGPPQFFSINGIGIPTAGGLFALWILLVSIALLIRAKNAGGTSSAQR